MKSAPLIVVASILLALPLFSQMQQSTAPQADDPPARVARLNWLSADVSFQPAGLEEWTTATLNYPLTTNDHLFTNEGARLELHIGSTALRLDSNSNFGFLNLDDNIVQVSLTDGSMEIRLRQLAGDDTFEIATPNGAITLLRAGDYRVDTNSDRDATMLTVRLGQAELYYGSDRIPVATGQTAYFQTDQNPDIRSANLLDDFDSFTEDRDGKVRLDTYVPNEPRYGRRARDVSPDDVSVSDLVSEGMTGAEDLASYGTWQNLPGLGPTWSPPVDPDWAPYSDGNWAYVEPWGWTWIDVAPWGFAPFHYGRWAYVNSTWVWVPGPKQRVQVYAPALVTFIGGGPADNVSWFPLAPRDLWIPPWRSRPDYSALPRLSTNRSVPGAIRTLPPRDFISGARVHPSTASAPEGQVLGSSPMTMPVLESLLVRPSRVHPPAFNKPLIVRTSPPAAPITFVATIGLLAQNNGRPLARGQVETLRRQIPAAVIQRPAVRSVPVSNAPKGTAQPARSTAGTAVH